VSELKTSEEGWNMDRRYVAAFLTGVVLVASGVGGFVVRPAEALSPASLPRDTLRIIALLLRGASPYVQQLSVNAIQAIPSDRARTMVNNLRGLFSSYPDAQIVQVGQQYDMAVQAVLQILPRNYHQKFIYGIWGVSDADEQFAQMVVQAVTQASRGGGTLGVPGAPRVVVPPVDMSHPTPSERGWLCALGGGFVNGAGHCQQNP
jgi:hypothetical protein